MGISLTIADNQNGTGTVATFTGSDPASSNALFAVDVPSLTLGIGVPAWVSYGTRIGDGTIAMPVPPGYFWAYATNQLGAGFITVIPPVLFSATLSPLSWWDQIANAAQAKIQALGLAGISSKNVMVRMLPWPPVESYPCVYLVEENEQETLQVSTNLTDDKEYPVRVLFKDRADAAGYDRKRTTYNLWRQQILTAFENRRLPGVPSVYMCKVQPTVMIDPNLPQYQFVVSGMTLRFVNREVRGR